MGVARTADNHHLAANFNHDVANPRSRITLDGHPRRRKLLSHDRVAKSFPGGTVGIGGNPAVPIAPRSGPEPPKSTARDLTRVRFQSCGGRECRMAPPAKSNQRRRATILRSGGVVRLEGRASTKRPRLAGGRGQRAGSLRQECLIRTWAGFPPQCLVGVDRLRCKWLNLNFATGLTERAAVIIPNPNRAGYRRLVGRTPGRRISGLQDRIAEWVLGAKTQIIGSQSQDVLLVPLVLPWAPALANFLQDV
jgi:hypothetical protein